ncbi:MAG: YeeE/YedE family protein [Syntrophaceae bacterium]|nr:YeeE/YedE family protein [Syntrophaceae bacterium]
MELYYGLITGALFGFLMQKSEVIRYEKQVGAMRLKDFTIFKFMLSAIIVGMIGIYLMKDMGMIKLSIKATVLSGNILGGVLFGIGWALLGYCPGTAAGALGEGRLDVVPGIAGMIIGAALYAEIYPFLNATLLKWGQLGKLTLPSVLQLDQWTVITGLTVIYIGLFIIFRLIRR